MKKGTRQFSARQVMIKNDFELFHNYNSLPIQIDYHSHDFYEAYFFLSGRVSYIIEGKTYHLRPGDILLTNSRELHKPLILDGKVYERFVLWLQPSYLLGLSDPDTNLSQCFTSVSQYGSHLIRTDSETFSVIHKLLERLEKIDSQAEFGSSVLKRAYLSELLVLLNSAYLGTSSAESDITYHGKIGDILHYINENLCEDLSLNLLSQKFYVSKYHLSREFKQYVGLPLHQYILKKRLISAKLFLLSGASVNTACMKSGFGDYSNFVKAFKQEFGISPKKYAMLSISKRL